MKGEPPRAACAVRNACEEITGCVPLPSVRIRCHSGDSPVTLSGEEVPELRRRPVGSVVAEATEVVDHAPLAELPEARLAVQLPGAAADGAGEGELLER